MLLLANSLEMCTFLQFDTQYPGLAKLRESDESIQIESRQQIHLTLNSAQKWRLDIEKTELKNIITLKHMQEDTADYEKVRCTTTIITLQHMERTADKIKWHAMSRKMKKSHKKWRKIRETFCHKLQLFTTTPA